MIILQFKNNKLILTLDKPSKNIFQKEVNYIKSKNFRYNSSTKEWVGSWTVYNEVKEYLEEIDTIDDQVNSEDIEELACGNQEQFNEKVRRIPDYSLLKYPPMLGKSPNENFQRDAIRTTINRGRYFLAWGMGSGKSYVASAIIAHRLIKFQDCSRVLLVTTSIGVRNLYHELLKFIIGLEEEDIKVVTKDNKKCFDSDSRERILIMSYNTFRLVCNEYRELLKIKSKKPRKAFLPIAEWCNGGEAMLLLDESHEVSHVESQRSQLMTLHSSLFKYRYLFSGTPADKPEKQYNQFKILDPWLVYNLSYTDWKNKMATIGNYFSKYAITWKRGELKKQNDRFIGTYGSRFNTLDLVDLPENYEKKIRVKMSKKHREIYEGVVTQTIKSNGTQEEIVNKFPFMSTSLDNPFLLEKHMDKFESNLAKKIGSFHESYLEKIHALDDILEDLDEKVLVWCTHPKTIEMLSKRYKKLNPICVDGDIPQEERFSLVEDFKKKDEHRMLIANITCLNTSVTITECKVQVYFERTYNYSQYEQSKYRIYRLSQTEDVRTFILIYENSLDEMLNKNLETKGALVDGLLKKDFLTQDQWVRIFNMNENSNINDLTSNFSNNFYDI